MDELPDRDDVAPDGDEPVPPVRRRRVLLFAFAGVLLAIVVVALWLTLRDDEPKIDPRDAPTADLLAWIPADVLTRRAFAVWTPDPGDAASGAALPLDLIDRLGFTPQPAGLGRDRTWSETYGWSAGLVTSWAAAGPNGEMAVLAGAFDLELIGGKLDALGYVRGSHRGARLWSVDEPSDAAPRAVAFLNDRIILADTPERARAAIDAARDGDGSLADDPTIARMLDAMAPLSALVAVSQAEHAVRCLTDAGEASSEAAGAEHYVMVGYGRAGDPSIRRTLVATSYPDESTATVARAPYETGWLDGFASVGGAGGSIDAFGRFIVVLQEGNVLVAELIEGRDDGWARAGVRFAIPVCEAALALAPPVSTDASGSGATLTAIQRLVASLPDVSDRGVFRAVDLATIAAVTGVAPGEAGSDARDEWWNAAAPLPSFRVIPLSLDGLSRWSETLGISLNDIEAVGEARAGRESDPVGVLIGAWNPASLSATLGALGYQSIELAGVRHFALPVEGSGTSELTEAAGAAWINIAIFGDRMWVSADQRAMRAAIDDATGGEPNAAARGLAYPPLMALRGATATAIEVVGAEYVVDTCGTVLPGLSAVGAAWSAQADGGEAAVFYVPAGTGSVVELATALNTRLASLRLDRSLPGDAGSGSPAPIETVALGDLLELIEVYGPAAPSATPDARGNVMGMVVARLRTTDQDRMESVLFFGGVTGACELATIL